MKWAALLLGLTLATKAGDWPTHRADAARSGITGEQLTLPLKAVWTHRSPQPPRPAWRGPAKRDLYNQHFNLHNRQTFDHAYQVIAAQGAVYYGSSADDQIYCLEADTGRVRWTFFTEGPVRLAPTFHAGRLFAGSDDGFVYCLDAAQGRLLWKTRLAPREYRVPGNGRVISAWPVRTGVLIDGGMAYAGAGLFPGEEVHLCALDEATGAVHWRSVQNDLPAEGHLLLSAQHLYVPAGRANPVVHDRATGRRLRALEGQGGTEVALLGDTVIFGPGRTGQLNLVLSGQQKVFTTLAGHLVLVTPEQMIISAGGELRAMDQPRFMKAETARQQNQAQISQLEGHIQNARRGKPVPKPLPELQKDLAQAQTQAQAIGTELTACVQWKRPCDLPAALVRAGETLFVGGEGAVAAYQARDGQAIWRQVVSGRALSLAVAQGRLLVSTDQGVIHCFASERGK